MSVQLKTILEVKPMESTIKIKLRVINNWRDERLTFANLQASDNVIGYASWRSMWIPDYILQDTKQFTETSVLPDEENSFVYLEVLNSSEYYSEYKSTRNNFYYEGSNVEIFKDNKYTIDFICHFNWGMYPFDSQDCKIGKECISSVPFYIV